MRDRARSVVFVTACWTTIIPLVLVLVVLGVTALRLRAEARRILEIEARVTSTWFADRLSDIEAERRVDFLRDARAKSGLPVGLFAADGTPIHAGGLDWIGRGDLQRLVAETAGAVFFPQQRYAVAAARIRAESASLYVLVAVSPSTAGVNKLAIALKLVVGALVLVFAAAVFGVSFGKDISRYLHGLRNRVQTMIEAERPPPISEETPIGGELGSLERSASELEERFRGELVMYRDAMEEVRILDEQKTAFLAKVSRELHAPLVRIVDLADQLISGKRDPLADNQAEDVRIVRQAGTRLLDMANDIFDLSALISKGIEYDEELVDLAEVAREVVETARGGLGEKDLEIRVEVKEGATPRVRGSRQRLWQVLTNLVSNGIKFTEHGEILVEIDQTEDGSAQVKISDTGVGIPTDDQGAIFDPFMQRGDLSKRLRGTGLGLAICKRLVDLHGGDIQVSSVEGEGSCFTVMLPSGGN